MDDEIEGKQLTDTPADASRRAFLKGVIGSGAAAFSAGYLFRASPGGPRCRASGAGRATSSRSTSMDSNVGST
jgi:hypothetical protein